MRPSSERAVCVLALAAATAASQTPARSAPAEPPFGRLTLVEQKVERATGEGPWNNAVEGSGFVIGEGLRTGPEGLARLDLPWMWLTLGPSSLVRVPDEYVLSAVLERGRAVIQAELREALKLVTGEAELRGRGRAVVRRESGATLVTSLAGSFVVEGAGSSVNLPAGKGTIVRAGQAPLAPMAPPAPPERLWPGSDPVYVAPGEPIEVRWKGSGAGYQIEVLPVGSDYILIQKDVTAPPAQIEIPWPGAFRWRVAARNQRGLEGVPSAEGLICVDAK